MAAYVAGQAAPINVGQRIQVTDGGEGTTTSKAVAVGRAGGVDSLVCIVNKSGQTITPQVAATDLDASYVPLYNPATGAAYSIPTANAMTLPCIGPFLRLFYSGNPTGAATIAR